jgi:hypothetical protein
MTFVLDKAIIRAHCWLPNLGREGSNLHEEHRASGSWIDCIHCVSHIASYDMIISAGRRRFWTYVQSRVRGPPLPQPQKMVAGQTRTGSIRPQRISSDSCDIIAQNGIYQMALR